MFTLRGASKRIVLVVTSSLHLIFRVYFIVFIVFVLAPKKYVVSFKVPGSGASSPTKLKHVTRSAHEALLQALSCLARGP